MKVNILRQNGRFTPFILLLGFILAIFTFSALQMNGGEDTAVYIIQGQNMEQMAAAVQDVGGTVTHELGIINAVGAELTPAQLAVLQENTAVTHIQANQAVNVTGKPVPNPTPMPAQTSTTTEPATNFPALIGANSLHGHGTLGNGIAIAVIHTGAANESASCKDIRGITCASEALYVTQIDF